MINRKAVILALAALMINQIPATAQDIGPAAAPVSNPTLFEDARIYSEIRPIYAYHEIDNRFVTDGGNVQIYALQARLKLTDDLAIIATKDGYVDVNTKSVVPKDDGFANVAAGVKYSVYKDECGNIATLGLRYEAPIGEHEALQGRGDGIINPFLAFGGALGDFNFLGSTGFQFPVDSADSTHYDLNLHADTAFGIFHPLVEMNLVQVLDGGKRLPIQDEGFDFFNLGSSGATGESMLTGGAGARIDLAKNVSFGAIYQFPLSRGDGNRITDWRLTTDLQIRF